MTELRIQYASDIHLELYADAKTFDHIIKPVSVQSSLVLCDMELATPSILILAGDIGRPDRALLKKFLGFVASKFEKVYYVAGNHEYYNADKKPSKWFGPDTMSVRLAMLQALCSETGVTLLNRGESVLYTDPVTEQSIVLLGATLWTRVGPDDTAAADSMNDFRVIYTDVDTRLTPATMSVMNAVDKTWLRERIHAHSVAGNRVVVVTHHLPTPSMIIDKYLTLAYAKTQCGFANTDMEDLIATPVVAWIAGHTHGCKTTTAASGTILTTNTLGYAGEGVVGYRPDAVIVIPFNSSIKTSSKIPNYDYDMSIEEVEFV